MEVEILSASSSKPLGSITINQNSTIKDVKKQVSQLKKGLPIERQSIRLQPREKTLDDKVQVNSLKFDGDRKLYLKDLGPQIGWKTVFLAEYAGPLIVYLWLYQRPWIFYGTLDSSVQTHYVVDLAAICYTVHYAKRILETLFVHRFSHATMPIRNLFKNCLYYWLFTMYVAYHVNHPLYTAPHPLIIYGGLLGFVFCEVGNFSIHIALRNLRPAGSTVRKIPTPTSNPFTILFNFVSCPNYTYEIGSWIAFTIMTSCLPAGIFTLAGAYQMTIWALGKHRNYRKEFSNYPKSRKAIYPFVI
ncbi:very-long-chain enoyl-CoA reductase [Chrysoperla carnea]|uniref:very-long-chain enoyl-CoA reductase n=1 Tax=Chrysoperla carnea TaxID=189513 RepID=UPI001D061758|nr:very-long-chain enoyl-CoA reductase [Chrysoperla carnea]